jgi:hypothetical protein
MLSCGLRVCHGHEQALHHHRRDHRLAPGQAGQPGDAGIGKDQITLNRWSLELGGHCRTGLEDNVRMSKEKLAPSNAALVKRVAELCAQYGRRPATVSEARRMLGL